MTDPIPSFGAGSSVSGAAAAAEAEVVDICRHLLRIDSSNYGDNARPSEREAAEYAATLLSEVGLDVEFLESAPGRSTLVTRISGEDPSRPALLVHGHLDVVPAAAEDWQVHPFSGEERGGCLWGRGAVDMKGMDAMILASVRDLVRSGARPRRDVVVAFVADEEAGGDQGGRWLVRNHGDLFEGVSEAVSEVGGYSVELAGRRAYLVQTGEKGLALAATRRARPGRSRVADQRRQRGDPAGRGGRPDRFPPVAAGDHADGAGLPRRRRGDHRSAPGPGRPGRAGGDPRDDGTVRGSDVAEHRESDRAERAGTRTTSSRGRPRPRSTRGSCPGVRNS